MVCHAKLAQLVFALQILARTAKAQFFFLNLLATSEQKPRLAFTKLANTDKNK